MVHSSLIKTIMGREERWHKKTSLFFLFADIILKTVTCLIRNCHSYSGSCVTIMANAGFISDKLLPVCTDEHRLLSVHKQWTFIRHSHFATKMLLESSYWINLWKHKKRIQSTAQSFQEEKIFLHISQSWNKYWESECSVIKLLNIMVKQDTRRAETIIQKKLNLESLDLSNK